jgi:hypothetical protein
VPRLRVVGCVAFGLSGVAQAVGGWVRYKLVSELLVETSGRYGSGLLVRVSWLRSIYDLEVENLRRNGIAESTWKLECQRSFVRDPRIVTVPFEFGSDRDRWIPRVVRQFSTPGIFVCGCAEGRVSRSLEVPKSHQLFDLMGGAEGSPSLIVVTWR